MMKTLSRASYKIDLGFNLPKDPTFSTPEIEQFYLLFLDLLAIVYLFNNIDYVTIL